MSDCLVKENMTSPVISISSDSSLSEARKIMTAKKIRRLPVVDNEKLVGIVSFTDVLEAKLASAPTMDLWELSQQALTMQIKDVMSSNIFSVEQSASVGEVASIMLEKKISGVPVTDNGKLVGMITESDLFRLMAVEGRYLSIHQQKKIKR